MSLAFAVLWVGLATWHPHVTYHLAPVGVAGLWPVALRRTGAGVRRVAWALVAATALAAIEATLLGARGILAGPTLLPGSSQQEAYWLTAATALAVAVRTAVAARRGHS